MPRNTLFFRQVNDLQSFKGNLGGFAASPITNSGDGKRPFSVDGDTFTDFQTAAQRSCDNQFQQCSQSANQQGNKGDLKVSDCDTQKSMFECWFWVYDGVLIVGIDDCNSAQQSAQVKDFNTGAASTIISPDPEFPDFDLICDA